MASAKKPIMIVAELYPGIPIQESKIIRTVGSTGSALAASI
jgi:hypothetical protein